jgi:hypothetical protein
MPQDRKRAAALLQDPDALRALLMEPKEWLKRYGLSETDIACTEEAHAGLAKAEKVAAKANELANLPLVEALPRLHELAKTVWDEDVVVGRIPFGVIIAEGPKPPLPRPIPPVPPLDDNLDVTTGTASVSCTFGLSCKADVDS